MDACIVSEQMGQRKNGKKIDFHLKMILRQYLFAIESTIPRMHPNRHRFLSTHFANDICFMLYRSQKYETRIKKIESQNESKTE